MEVHHHPKVEKKRFKEYFFEFLMIFLAVTLGFIAENIREDISNHTKEKGYMKNMLQDVINDTTILNNAIVFASNIGLGLDSLSKALYAADGTHNNTLEIYRLHAMYSRRIRAELNDQTTVQLRSSGGLQLIKKNPVVVVLVNYWRGITGIANVIENLHGASSDNDYAYGIFNSSYEHFTGIDSATGMSLVSIDPMARLMSNDKNILINYANRVSREVSIINVFLLRNLNRQKKLAANLIASIKKEYHLE